MFRKLLRTVSNKPKRVLVGLVAVIALVGLAAMPVRQAFSTQARDCDSNAVMNCGAYSKSEWTSKYNANAGNVQGIYNEWSIDTTEFNSADTVDGVVTKTGQVIVNGQVVASNVWTAGRHNIQGSVQSGSVWMRPPSVSFKSSQLEAYVNMEGGTFHWAVIKSCGNPVKTINKPFGQIFKRVVDLTQDPNTNHAADDKAHALEIKAGDTLRYDVTITNNGTAPMTNTHMKDELPAGITLVSNPAKRIIETDAFGTVDVSGVEVYTITVKADKDFQGTVDPDGFLYISNQACFTADQSQKGCDTAVVKQKKQPPTKQPKKSFVCSSLTGTPTSGNFPLKVHFTAQADFTGDVKIEDYFFDFGDSQTAKIGADKDSKKSKTQVVDHTYQKSGKYTATVVVNTSAGSTKPEECSVQIGPKETPKTPPKTPPSGRLPNTGPEEFLGATFGTGALGASIRSWIRSKRNVKAALLKG